MITQEMVDSDNTINELKRTIDKTEQALSRTRKGNAASRKRLKQGHHQKQQASSDEIKELKGKIMTEREERKIEIANLKLDHEMQQRTLGDKLELIKYEKHELLNQGHGICGICKFPIETRDVRARGSTHGSEAALRTGVVIGDTCREMWHADCAVTYCDENRRCDSRTLCPWGDSGHDFPTSQVVLEYRFNNMNTSSWTADTISDTSMPGEPFMFAISDTYPGIKVEA